VEQWRTVLNTNEHECQEFVGKVTHCLLCEEMGLEYVMDLPILFAKCELGY
jgi:hypothetical protein